MSLQELLPDQPVTNDGSTPSLELVEIIQALKLAIEDLEARVTALEP